jgi:dethiobiotin synthase
VARRIVVTGTDTGVGKTVVVALLAQAFRTAGQGVRVVKPVQTGAEPGEPGDADEVNRMLGETVAEEWQRLALPLAPETIAHETGVELIAVPRLVDRLRELSEDVIIVEGAGGVLVRLDTAGGTIADLAEQWGAEVVVVTRDTLGTLNHSGLTVRYLHDRELAAVMVIGAATPAGELNHRELRRLVGPVIGRVPHGAPEAAEFSDEWLTR